MEEIKQVIEDITYLTQKYPEKEFERICERPEESIPYLREAIDKAIELQQELDPDYMLHLYALVLLAEFEDRDSFDLIVRMVSFPEDMINLLLGDFVVEQLNNVLYLTYNGDLELLKNTIRNPAIDDYVRSDMLDVMGQLYLDGDLDKESWQEFLKELVYTEDLGGMIYTSMVDVICKCHFADMRPDIRSMFERELVDEYVYGQYDSCLDYMFEYRDDSDSRFCEPQITIECLRSWAMWQDREEPDSDIDRDIDRDKLFEDIFKEIQSKKTNKIGRNDPCPCGSGKKYKFCCLMKPKSELDLIEDKTERDKWLSNYPELPEKRVEGRIYLDDFYDEESIEIDRYVYLALHHRAIPIWEREDESIVKKRQTAYLSLAYERFVKKMETEGIDSLAAYNKKYAIHYICEQWLCVLLDLLEEQQEWDQYDKVRTFVGTKFDSEAYSF